MASGSVFPHLDADLRRKYWDSSDPATLHAELTNEFTQNANIHLIPIEKQFSDFRWNAAVDIDGNLSNFKSTAEACKLLGRPKSTKKMTTKLLFSTENIPPHLQEVRGRLAEQACQPTGVWDEAGEPITISGGLEPLNLNLDLFRQFFVIAKQPSKVGARDSSA